MKIPQALKTVILMSDHGDVRCVQTLQFHYACLYIVCLCLCVCVCVCVPACACVRKTESRQMHLKRGVGQNKLHIQCMYFMCSTCKHFSTTYSAENITWTEQLTPITVESFNKTAGPKVPIPRSANEIFFL